MPYTNDWTTTNNPADHSKFKNIPSYVRKVRTDVEERLASMLYGFTSGETDTGAKKLLFKDQAGDASTPGAGFLAMYAKTVSSVLNFYFVNAAGTVIPFITGLGGALTGAINEAQGANIASATTCDIGAATGNYVKVTGTTTITGFGTVQAGTRRIVEFTGALTLTHNASSLILPTAANITTVAGDVATMVSLGSGNWKCVSYQRNDGTAVGGTGIVSGMIFLWSGSIGTIPSGFVLCDGSNSTPDLRAKFVYGASDEATAGHASPGSSGGALTLAGNDSSVSGTFTYPAGPTSGPSGPTSPYAGATQDVMPPYYALAYIMKS